MKALTLRHPWAFSIAHWGKRIENRSWKPWKEVVGQRIAIHGGEIPKGKALRDAEMERRKAMAAAQGAIVDAMSGHVLSPRQH
ncbi:hypothetical protein UFOVP1229_36 [uncultured Caudovirales phage]|uniref:Uncharacterized protein n=1 Tax=uncultured Caudovirales phage TaxID=2100421 RepID=A0A6J5RAW0_9CAUD|nr:hypothetical protein UFOVP1229_36 [uncultured Caudovirales phage]